MPVLCQPVRLSARIRADNDHRQSTEDEYKAAQKCCRDTGSGTFVGGAECLNQYYLLNKRELFGALLFFFNQIRS
jgi:hypothetical protein